MEEEHIVECETCGSMEMVQLGCLGNTLWLRCQSCGMQQSQDVSEDK